VQKGHRLHLARDSHLRRRSWRGLSDSRDVGKERGGWMGARIERGKKQGWGGFGLCSLDLMFRA